MRRNLTFVALTVFLLVLSFSTLAESNETCAVGCPVDYVGDTICDEECNNAACSYDLGDCNTSTTSLSTSQASTAAVTSSVANLQLLVSDLEARVTLYQGNLLTLDSDLAAVETDLNTLLDTVSNLQQDYFFAIFKRI